MEFCKPTAEFLTASILLFYSPINSFLDLSCWPEDVELQSRLCGFDGKADFGIWKWKIKSLLSHHKVGVALIKDGSKWTTDQKSKRAEIEEEALNLLVLNLSDNVLRKVDGASSALKL